MSKIVFVDNFFRRIKNMGSVDNLHRFSFMIRPYMTYIWDDYKPNLGKQITNLALKCDEDIFLNLDEQVL